MFSTGKVVFVLRFDGRDVGPPCWSSSRLWGAIYKPNDEWRHLGHSTSYEVVLLVLVHV